MRYPNDIRLQVNRLFEHGASRVVAVRFRNHGWVVAEVGRFTPIEGAQVEYLATHDGPILEAERLRQELERLCSCGESMHGRPHKPSCPKASPRG